MEKATRSVLSSVNSYLDADNPPEAILICFPLFNLVPGEHRVPFVSGRARLFFPSSTSTKRFRFIKISTLSRFLGNEHTFFLLFKTLIILDRRAFLFFSSFLSFHLRPRPRDISVSLCRGHV